VLEVNIYINEFYQVLFTHFNIMFQFSIGYENEMKVLYFNYNVLIFTRILRCILSLVHLHLHSIV